MECIVAPLTAVSALRSIESNSADPIQNDVIDQLKLQTNSKKFLKLAGYGDNRGEFRLIASSIAVVCWIKCMSDL